MFQVLATDPDNPMSPSGTLRYKIQDDIEDANTFRIGIIYHKTLQFLHKLIKLFDLFRPSNWSDHYSQVIG